MVAVERLYFYARKEIRMTKEYLIKLAKAAGIRAVKTWCQTFVASIPTAAAILSDVNWVYVLSASTLAALVCFVWNVGTGLPEVKLEQLSAMQVDEPPDSFAEVVYTEEELAEMRNLMGGDDDVQRD